MRSLLSIHLRCAQGPLPGIVLVIDPRPEPSDDSGAPCAAGDVRPRCSTVGGSPLRGGLKLRRACEERLLQRRRDGMLAA